MNEHTKGLARAIAWASAHHMKDFDRGGRPYIQHTLWVMNNVLVYGDDHGILGVCHDVIEDKFKGKYDAGFAEFREKVINDPELEHDLDLLTHNKDVLNYQEYITRIKLSGRIRPLRVKCKDLEHNSMITRAKGLSPKDMERIRMYHASYMYLTDLTDKLYAATMQS